MMGKQQAAGVVMAWDDVSGVEQNNADQHIAFLEVVQ